MTGHPDCMTARPHSASSDPLSEVLSMIRLEGAVFLDNKFTAPWCLLSAIEPRDCAPYLFYPRQIIAYHLVVEGRVMVRLPGHPPVTLYAGDAVVLPRNDPHYLASDVATRPMDPSAYMQPPTAGSIATLELGGGGALTRLHCGFLASADASNPVIAALPPLLTLNLRSYEAYDWIESSIRFAMQELMNGRLPSSGMTSRLSELLFVEAVRKFVTENARDYSWLDGFRDPQLGRALMALHRDLQRRWSVEDLAQEAGMSRSAFSVRFNEVLNQSPIKYLTVWRLRAGQTQLRDGSTIARAAEAVGYESEEAFSRAFKREFGLSPALWRLSQSAGDIRIY
jgi:AraC-like DNA-binding protein